jgi:hypothetical protein
MTTHLQSLVRSLHDVLDSILTMYSVAPGTQGRRNSRFVVRLRRSIRYGRAGPHYPSIVRYAGLHAEVWAASHGSPPAGGPCLRLAGYLVSARCGVAQAACNHLRDALCAPTASDWQNMRCRRAFANSAFLESHLAPRSRADVLHTRSVRMCEGCQVNRR